MRKMRILGVTAITAGLLLSGAGIASADDTAPEPASGSAVLVQGLQALLTGSAGAPETVAEEDEVVSGSAVLLKGLEALLTGSSAAPAE